MAVIPNSFISHIFRFILLDIQWIVRYETIKIWPLLRTGKIRHSAGWMEHEKTLSKFNQFFYCNLCLFKCRFIFWKWPKRFSKYLRKIGGHKNETPFPSFWLNWGLKAFISWHIEPVCSTIIGITVKWQCDWTETVVLHGVFTPLLDSSLSIYMYA